MLVTLGLICVEIGVGPSDSTMVIPKSLMHSVLLLPFFCSWGGRGWRWAMSHQDSTASPGAPSVGKEREALAWTTEESPALTWDLACSVPEQRLNLC